jgi:hypothetical protein
MFMQSWIATAASPVMSSVPVLAGAVHQRHQCHSMCGTFNWAVGLEACVSGMWFFTVMFIKYVVGLEAVRRQ